VTKTWPNFFVFFSRFSGRGTHQAETVLERLHSKNEILQKKSIFGQFLPILATFLNNKSRFEKSW
jgi:hypothetical protein